MDKTSVNFLIIGTNNYYQLAQECKKKIIKYGSKNLDIRTTIFTNIENAEPEYYDKNGIINIDHMPWPLITLLRYNIFYKYRLCPCMSSSEYTYYIDADLHPEKEFGEEILGDRVFTIHPGYFAQPKYTWPFENNSSSRAYLHPNASWRYYIGAFQGGKTSEFFKMCEILKDNINFDLKNNYIARWHDESHMNRYAVDNPPTKELTPSFCYPEGHNLPFEQVFIAKNKNHDQIRAEL